jgi:hypothetical protein
MWCVLFQEPPARNHQLENAVQKSPRISIFDIIWIMSKSRTMSNNTQKLWGHHLHFHLYISIRATIGARSHGSIVAPWSPQDHLGEESRCWDRRWGANFHAIGQVTREDLRAIRAIASLEMIKRIQRRQRSKPSCKEHGLRRLTYAALLFNFLWRGN